MKLLQISGLSNIYIETSGVEKKSSIVIESEPRNQLIISNSMLRCTALKEKQLFLISSAIYFDSNTSFDTKGIRSNYFQLLQILAEIIEK